MKKIGKEFMILMFICFAASSSDAQELSKYFKTDKEFTESIEVIVNNAGLNKTFDAGEDGLENISFAVIDLSGRQPKFAGYHADNFIYPASVYKMYVAMEILKQINEGKYSLFEKYVVQSPNDVDRNKEIAWDPRPLLKAGDTVTIRYLLDLMITRSDNTAANCLIDIAGRPHINKTIQENNWHGSEVTRKFLKRSVEAPGYDTVRSTVTNAIHAADFMYKIYTEKLINPWVSRQLKGLLAGQLDTTKFSAGLPHSAMFYHKTGWWGPYTNDVGIVENGNVKYIIALFLPMKENEGRLIMKQVAADVDALMQKRNKRK